MTSFFIKTYGCAHNMADSEFMAGLLVEAEYKQSENIKDADIVLINTCTVKDPSEKKFFTELERIKVPVLVTGCIPQADKNNEKLQNYSLLGVKQIHRVLEAVDETLKGNKIRFLGSDGLKLNLPRIRKNEFIEIIPVSNGCLGSCTFCKTKHARGHLDSFPQEDIIKQVRNALNDGIREIWLTSEDLGAYGLDKETNLPELLNEILKINKKFRLRLGMINPEYVFRFTKEIIEILKDPRVFKFMHIPVQAGNNRVLEVMKRPYTVEEFKESINALRKEIPEITIATDIICGFPSETDKEFEDTINLVKEIKPPVMNISKFYPRSNTPAARMKLLPTHIVKERSKIISNLRGDLIDKTQWLDEELEVTFNEMGKDNNFIARNNSYKQIIVKSKKALFGKTAKVRIINNAGDYLEAIIIS